MPEVITLTDGERAIGEAIARLAVARGHAVA